MAAEQWGAAQYALDAIQKGLTASEGLQVFRQAGGKIANETWYKLTGEIQAVLAEREGVLDEPLNRVPTAGEIRQWTTTGAKGFIQQVEVLVRDKETGQVMSVPFSHTGKTLRSRRAVLKDALSIYSDDNAKRYNQSILGAVYTGTYQAVPEGE